MMVLLAELYSTSNLYEFLVWNSQICTTDLHVLQISDGIFLLNLCITPTRYLFSLS